MEMRQLRYFVALAEELNFGRAANRLHISQPPLTRQIQQLEEELGVRLFLRTPKGVELTTAGTLLLEDAANILALMQRAQERTQLAGSGHLGRIDVGIFGSAMLNAWWTAPSSRRNRVHLPVPAPTSSTSRPLTSPTRSAASGGGPGRNSSYCCATEPKRRPRWS